MTVATRYKIERREDVGVGLQLLALAIALAAALLVTSALISAAGAAVLEGYRALWQGAFGTQKALIASLVKATPLILTGLATAVAFRGQIWNIGQEGQLYSGAIAAYWAYRVFAEMPPAALIPIILFAAVIGGAACGLIAGLVKVKFGVDEIITTIMLNYLVIYLLSWLVSNPWRDPGSYYQQSSTIAETAHLPLLVEGTRLHVGFLIALLVALVLYVLLEKTPLGYEIRAIGLNPTAARFQGIDVAQTVVLVLMLSGAISGLAGVGELFGIHYRLKSDISLGYGYTGIIIAMLAGLHPLTVVPAAFLFGGLINGAFMLQITTHVPAALVDVLQAVVLLFLLSARAACSYRVRRVRDA